MVDDGPDRRAPRRTRRTRADDAPAPRDPNGPGRTDGPGDDVLGRLGLRTTASDDDAVPARRRRAADDDRRAPDPVPPGRRVGPGGSVPPVDRGPRPDGEVRGRPPRDELANGDRPAAPPRGAGAEVVPEAIGGDRTSTMPPLPDDPPAAEPRTGRRRAAEPVDTPRDRRTPAPDAPPPPPPTPDVEQADDGPPSAARDTRAQRGRRSTQPTGRRRRRVLRIGAVIVALVVFAACASGFTSLQRLEAAVRTVSALDPSSDAISNRATQTGDENVLVIGLPPNRDTVPEPQRSDTAVLVHVPSGGAPAVTLGIPAALEVSRPPCERWDPGTGAYSETVPAESRTAFSAAFDVGGPRCAVGVVQQLTGLVVTRFVAVDLSSADALVNAVRGVSVCTERPVVDPQLGPVVTRPGETVLAGTEAQRFAAASGVDDVSAADRVRRQQRVLSSVLDTALSTPSLLTPGASDRIARAMPSAVMADGADLDELLVLSSSLARTGSADGAPPFLSVPVNDQPNTRGHLELRRSDSSDLFSAMRKHEPLPDEIVGAARLAATTALPAGTVVDVLNAAGRPGVAGEAAGALRAQGYLVGAVRDADATPDSIVRFSPDRAAAAGVLAGSVPGTRPEAEPAGSGRLELVLGASFPGPAAITPPPRQEGRTADCG